METGEEVHPLTPEYAEAVAQMAQEGIPIPVDIEAALEAEGYSLSYQYQYNGAGDLL